MPLWGNDLYHKNFDDMSEKEKDRVTDIYGKDVFSSGAPSIAWLARAVEEQEKREEKEARLEAEKYDYDYDDISKDNLNEFDFLEDYDNSSNYQSESSFKDKLLHFFMLVVITLLAPFFMFGMTVGILWILKFVVELIFR